MRTSILLLAELQKQAETAQQTKTRRPTRVAMQMRILLFLVVATAAYAPRKLTAIVNLGSVGDTGVDTPGFAIITKAGILTTPGSVVHGHIGVSLIATTAMTGFGRSADPSNLFSTTVLVTGKCCAADYAEPSPTLLTISVSDIEAAYTDAVGAIFGLRALWRPHQRADIHDRRA